MVALFTGCTFGKTAGEAMENETSQTKESIPENVSFAEETTSPTGEIVSETVESTENTESSVFELGKIYMDDALEVELEKTDKASYYMVLVTENTGIDDEAVNRKFVERVGLNVIHNSYLRNHIIHIKPEGIRKLRCPENMSISLQLAFPVEYYDKNLRDVENWKEMLLVDEMFVKVVLEGEPGDYVVYENIVDEIEKFMKEYELEKDEKIYFSYDMSYVLNRELYLVLSKNKIEKMLNDDRVKSISLQRARVLEDFMYFE
jgi:hypothetical protein